MKYKKIIRYLICLLPWFISSLIFKVDTQYYKSLNLPFFAPPTVSIPYYMDYFIYSYKYIYLYYFL